MSAHNLLSKKLAGGGVARSPLPDPNFIGQSFAHLIEEVLRPLIKTIISAMVLECHIVKVPVALADVSVPAMLGLIEVEGAKLNGLMSLDTDLTFHLVDLMLGGDPSVAPIPIARSFTAVDMSLCHVPLDALLAAFGKAIANTFGRPMTREMKIRGLRQNITQLRLAPDHGDMLVYNIALDIGEAARSGTLHLFLPLSTVDAIRASVQDEGNVVEESAETASDLWGKLMRLAAANAAIPLDAVIHKRRMSIGALEAMKPGDVFEIPPTAPKEIAMTLDQPGGKTLCVARAHLGAFQGQKVVKLNEDIDPRVRDQRQFLRG